MSSLLITSRCAIRGRSELHFLGQPHVTVVSHRIHIRLFALTRGSQETGHAAIACNCDDGLKRNAPPLRSIYEQMTTSNLVSKAISSGTWALLHRSRSPVHAPSRSHYRSSDGLSAIVYCPNVEGTDDVVNRNEAFPGTPHGDGSPAFQRPRQGRQLEHLSSGAQSSTMVFLRR